METVRLTKGIPFHDYVYQDWPVEHSGVLSPALDLNPEYGESNNIMLRSLSALEEYATYSITAYRVIAWWAFRLDAPSFRKDVVRHAAKILARIEKPKQYLVHGAMMHQVED